MWYHPDMNVRPIPPVVDSVDFAERAGIMEYLGGLPRPEAERKARECEERRARTEAAVTAAKESARRRHASA